MKINGDMYLIRRYMNNLTHLLFQIQDLILVTAMNFLVFWVRYILFVLELHTYHLLSEHEIKKILMNVE